MKLEVELFVFFHDTQGFNEYTDPGHGKRAADFAQQSNGLFIFWNPGAEQSCNMPCSTTATAQ